VTALFSAAVAASGFGANALAEIARAVLYHLRDQLSYGHSRATPSLSRPTVNNELQGVRLTRSIPVAFASRNNEGSYDACGTHELCLAAPAILPQRVPPPIFKSRI
jgi:hypothetical protein